jgi:leucyl/phenylalanyl-tRNA--protein transferase
MTGESALAIESRTKRAPASLAPCRYRFPDPRRSRDGLVAVGADFAPETIVAGYRLGVFPWPHPAEEFAWFSPDPRAIIPIDGLHVSSRLARTLRQGRFRCTVDAAFEQVIMACALPRADDEGTWITPRIRRAYLRLHELGWAHSVEVWTSDGVLAGGLYGVAVGRMYGAESMFHTVTDASKVAMVAMMQHAKAIGVQFVDIQVLTAHTRSMGGIEITRDDYLARLGTALDGEARWFAGEDGPDAA